MTYDADSRIRGYALEAVGRALCLRGPGSVVVTGVARPHCARLAKLLETEVTDDVFRRAAARIFADMAPEGSEPHSESLAKALLKDPDAEVRRLAVKALEGLGIEGAPYEEHLVIALDDKDEVVRRRVARTLRNLGEGASRHLGRKLSDDNPDVRASAAQSLGGLGRGAAQYEFALGKLLEDEELPVREAAIQALRQVLPARTGSWRRTVPAVKQETSKLRECLRKLSSIVS
ncbi:unnamed protein product [Polarella glacialis]|uniref:HEAT repeat domain-containing protein n=1 Tax=Polarella glacialis TaxID=89957 RepID=A0A813G789_POLGL|nr:unnamed protein product [Polarella glacialis]